MAVWSFITAHPLDSFAFLVFFLFTVGYHTMYYYLVRKHPSLIFKGKINVVRRAWVAKIFEENKGILAVQTLRNVTMAASFMTTASVFLIGGLVSLLLNLEGTQHFFYTNGNGEIADPLLALKLINLVVLFSASLLYFSLCVRLLNHVGMLLGAPPEAIRDAMGEDPVYFVYRLHAKAGRHYTFGMRTFYFLGPAVLWLVSPILCIIATVGVGLICIKLDFGRIRLRK